MSAFCWCPKGSCTCPPGTPVGPAAPNREQFEALYTDFKGVPEGWAQGHRMGDSYRLPKLSSAWYWFQEAQRPLLERIADLEATEAALQAEVDELSAQRDELGDEIAKLNDSAHLAAEIRTGQGRGAPNQLYLDDDPHFTQQVPNE